MKRRRHRARLSIPVAVLSVLIVAVFFAATMTGDQQGEKSGTELPEVTVTQTIKPDKPSQEPVEYIPDEAEVEMLARTIWGEARGIPSDMEKAAVVWCILNRVDAEGWPDTVAEVVTQPNQFAGYSPDYPATEELKALAADVLTRWEREKLEGGDVGRVLPAEYTFFTGDGTHNHFRTEYRGGTLWDWSLKNPYTS